MLLGTETLFASTGILAERFSNLLADRLRLMLSFP
jgi:hypothetical protein